jgi:hypothetical protein
MSTKVNMSKTVTLDSTVFMTVVAELEKSGTSFSEELNILCHDGIEARKAKEAQEQPTAGGAEDGGE